LTFSISEHPEKPEEYSPEREREEGERIPKKPYIVLCVRKKILITVPSECLTVYLDFL